MRPISTLLATSAAFVLVAPSSATADDVSAQLERMQRRMDQLEDQLDATSDQLAASEARAAEQQRLLERAGLEDRSAVSGLSRFLEATEISGFIAASYNYNFNHPSAAAVGSQAPLGAASPADSVRGWNGGALGLTAPLHSNPNTFQLDQLWFSLSKPASEESRGGWGADIVFGTGADVANSWTWGWDDSSNVGTLPHLYQAYVSYLAPVAGGIEIRAGRWETPLGAEPFRQDRSFNITRGLLWTLQPVNHTGVLFSGGIGERVTWSLGVANQNGNTMTDTDNSKTGVGQIKWWGETITLAVNGMIGGDVYPALLGLGRPSLPGDGNPGTPGIGRDGDYLGVVDVVATWDPSDELSMWLDFDTIFTHGDGLPDNNIYAVAVAGRLVVSEATRFSLRGEYVRGEDVFNGSTIVAGDEAAMGLPTFAGASDIDLFSLTGTFDHHLGEHLTVRVEGRYDIAYLDGAPNRFFVADKDPGTVRSLYRRDDQVLALVEMLYEF